MHFNKSKKIDLYPFSFGVSKIIYVRIRGKKALMGISPA